MLGLVEVEVTVRVERQAAPEPDILLEDLQDALNKVEQKYPGIVTFHRFRLVNLTTGLEVLRGDPHAQS